MRHRARHGSTRRLKTIVCAASIGIAPGVVTAQAAPVASWYDLPWLGAPKRVPAVVAAEREVSLTAEGMLGNDKEYPKNPAAHDRELGWTPGVTLRASSVFDLYRLHDLYASAEGNFDGGHVAYHGSWGNAFGAHGPFESTTNQQKAYGQVELGKAWRLSPRLLLITAAQGGYGYWYRSLNSGTASYAGIPGIVTFAPPLSIHVHGTDERYRYA